MRSMLRSLVLALLAIPAGMLPAAPPDPPTGLSALPTGLSGRVSLSWSAVTTSGSLSGYEVYQATAPVVPGISTFVSTTSKVLTGLPDGVTSYFWVASEDTVTGVGGVGLTVTAVPYQVPDAPVWQFPQVLDFGAGVTLSWTAGATYGLPVGATRLEQSTGGAYTQVRSLGPGVSLTVQPIPCGVGVSLRARTVDAAGNSGAPSASILVSAPCAPTLSAVVMDGGATSFSWTPAITTASFPVAYALRSAAIPGTSADPLPTLETGTTAVQLSYTAAAPPVGTSRWYRLYTQDNAGVLSAGSDEIGLLAPPTSLTAIPVKGRVILQWSRPVQAQAKSLTAYQVYYATFSPPVQFDALTSVTVVADIGSGSFMGMTVTGLSDFQPYWFAVASQGGTLTAAVGSASVTVSAAPGLVSPVITSLQGLGGTSLNLAWTAVDVEGNNPANYLVYRATDAFISSRTLLMDTTQTSATGLPLPAAGTMAYYFVAVSDSTGTTSHLTPTVSIQAPALDAPTLTSTAATNGRVQLNWNAVAAAGLYRVYRATLGVISSTPVFETQPGWTTNGLSYIDTTPVNGEQNVYAVAAELPLNGTAGSVAGALSNSVTVTPWVLPGIPGRYSAGFGSSSFGYITAVARPGGPGVDLSWRPSDLGSTVLSGYQVYRGYSLSALTLTAFVPAGLSFTAYSDTSAPLPFGSLVYGVQAQDISGFASVTVVATVGTAAAWPAPLNLAATVLSGGVRLSWASPAGTGTYAFAAYDITRVWQVGGPEEAISPVTSISSLTVTAVTDISPDASQGTQPAYLVRIRDAVGVEGAAVSLTASLSGASAWNTTPTPAVLLGAQVLTGTATPVLLSWRPNPQAEAVTAYQVFLGAGSLGITSGLSWTDATSIPGSLNAYGVRAFNSHGQGLSNTVLVTLAPPAPGWVSLTNDVDPAATTSPALHLSWQDLNAPVGVTGYLVYRASPASVGMAGAVLITATSATSYADTAPAVGVPSAYEVLSIVGGQPSLTITPQAGLAAMDMPMAPLGFTASAGTGNLLSWTREAAAREYWVYRATWPLASPPDVAPLTRTVGTTWNDLSGGSSLPLHYAVEAANALGRGPAAMLTLTPVPGLPTNVVAQAGFTGTPLVNLSWTAPVPPNDAANFSVYRATSAAMLFAGTGSFLTTTGTPFYADPIGMTNTAWYYLVNSVGLVERPSMTAVSATAFNKPGVLKGVSATGSANGVDLRWIPAPASDGVDTYRLDILYAGLTSTVQLPAGSSSYHQGGLMPGTTVNVTLTAYSDNGQAPSDFNVTISAFANQVGAAAAPLSASASVGFRETVPTLSRVVLGWAPVGASNTVDVYKSVGPMSLSLAVGGPLSPYYLGSVNGAFNFLTDTAVTAKTAYSYAISAVSPDGLPGGESTAVPLGPVTPFNYSDLVSLSATAGDARVDLQWGIPAYGGSYGLGSVPYLLYRYMSNSIPPFKSIPPDGGFPLAFPLTVTAFSDTFNLVNDSTYFYYMSTVDTLGQESVQAQFPRLPAPLTASAAAMTPRGPLRPPANLTAIAGDGTVALRWVVAQSDALLNAKFNVYRRLASGTYSGPLPDLFHRGPDSSVFVNVSLVVVTLSDHPLLDPPVDKTSYCYCLAAVNSWGEGPKSREMCVTPFKPLQPPAGGQRLNLTVSGKKDIYLAWAAALPLSGVGEGGYDVQGYRVYRSQDGGNTYMMLTQVAAVAAPHYTDQSTVFGAAYLYRVVPLDTNNNEGLSYSLETVVIPAAKNALLIFKNAFNPAVGESVPMQYSLQEPGHAWVKVYTLNGEFVKVVFDEDTPIHAGDGGVYLSDKKTWDGTNADGQVVASGVYLIHLEANGFRANARVAVIK